MGSRKANSVRLRRRRWVYDGLARPPEVALVAPTDRAPTHLPRRILLIGGEVAQAIGPPLHRLSQDAGVQLVLDIRLGVVAADWLEQGWYLAALDRYRPQLVLLGFTEDQDHAALERMGALTPVPALWLAAALPEQPVRGPEPVQLPRSPDTMAPTAAGYAAWAAEVYQAMHRYG
jgi:hypothetical protein